MPRDFDLEDDDYLSQHGADDADSVTCKRCGTKGLSWYAITSPDGRRERRYLVDDRIRKHVCPATANDF